MSGSISCCFTLPHCDTLGNVSHFFITIFICYVDYKLHVASEPKNKTNNNQKKTEDPTYQTSSIRSKHIHHVDISIVYINIFIVTPKCDFSNFWQKWNKQRCSMLSLQKQMRRGALHTKPSASVTASAFMFACFIQRWNNGNTPTVRVAPVSRVWVLTLTPWSSWQHNKRLEGH